MNTVPGPFAALQLARLRQAAEGVQDGALERDQLRAEATALQEEVSGCFLLLSVVPLVSPLGALPPCGSDIYGTSLLLFPSFLYSR